MQWTKRDLCVSKTRVLNWQTPWKVQVYMGVSKNSGTPKSSILIRVFHYKSSIIYVYQKFNSTITKTHIIYIYIHQLNQTNAMGFHCEKTSAQGLTWRPAMMLEVPGSVVSPPKAPWHLGGDEKKQWCRWHLPMTDPWDEWYIYLHLPDHKNQPNVYLGSPASAPQKKYDYLDVPWWLVNG